MLKYASGVPFHRFERLQANVQIPLPASTQWEILRDTARVIRPAMDELLRHAPRARCSATPTQESPYWGSLPPTRASPTPAKTRRPAPQRKGVFASGIVSTHGGHRVAPFLTGHRHAAQNLAQVLAKRAADLDPAIHICDALSRNLPKPLEVILGHCLAHAGRKSVDTTARFPADRRCVLQTLCEIYRHDGQARDCGPATGSRFTRRRGARSWSRYTTTG
jgi:transposase